jgi:putative hemolysin
MSALQLFGVLLLIGINAFFAATEFSLVAVRVSRVRQLSEKGDPRAKIVEQLLGDIGRVVSGVQVGITIASLLLGYLGEVTLSRVLNPLVEDIRRPWGALVAHAVALVLAFGLLTFFQVVLGELVPKGLKPRPGRARALFLSRARFIGFCRRSARRSICWTASPKSSCSRWASSRRTATRSSAPPKNCK